MTTSHSENGPATGTAPAPIDRGKTAPPGGERPPERNPQAAGRLAWVDMLKGFAIFCVVMGHFLAWTFAPDADRGQYPVFVKEILYTFHLPLFFFLSGFVSELGRKTWNLETWRQFIVRRFQGLLVPGLAFLVLSFLFTGCWSFSWFLAALFEMAAVFSVTRLLLSKLGANWLVEMAAHGLVWAGLAANVTLGGTAAWQQFISLKLMVVFHPFFLCGCFACRWDLPRRVSERGWIYTVALLIYAAFLYERFACGRLPVSVTKYPVGLCAVVVFLRLAMDGNPQSRLGRLLGLLGRNSLGIFLLSPCFIPWFPGLGDLFIRSDAFVPYGLEGFRHVSSVFLQLVTGGLVSAYVCAACLVARKIVSRSALLDFLLFGTRKRR